MEELGILADRRSASDPEAAIGHLRRALELDPTAVGAKHMLERLLAKHRAAEAESEVFDELELEDIDDLELLPMVADTADAAFVEPDGDPEATEADADTGDLSEWQGGNATQMDTGLSAHKHLYGADAASGPATPPEGTPVVPSMDELEIEFDLPVSASAPSPASHWKPVITTAPLSADAQGELEQVDFFLEQGLADDALALLDELGPALANHPEVRSRRERALGFGGGETEPTNVTMEPPVTLAPTQARHEGAVPTDDRGTGNTRSAQPSPRVLHGAGNPDATTQRDLGIAYKEMGLMDAALAEFSKLVDDPDNQVFALMMMGECYEADGSFAEALTHYKRALNRPAIRDEEATQLYFLLGRAFEALGDSGEALYFFEKVMRRDSDFADVATRVERMRRSGVAPVDHTGTDAGSTDERRQQRGVGTGPRGSR